MYIIHSQLSEYVYMYATIKLFTIVLDDSGKGNNNNLSNYHYKASLLNKQGGSSIFHRYMCVHV